MHRIKQSKNKCLTSLMGLLLLTAGGCSTAVVSVSESNSAETAFKAAQDFENDERFEEAIAKFNEVKNKHPYSKYATEAELHIADIHYKKEEFIESANSYQLFKDFHPKHPKSDYVTYRLAMSYYMQLPSSADRDLAPSVKALQFFDECINAYASSPYVKECQDDKYKTLHMLAEKEAYIGNFYFIRNVYDSAYRRYSALVARYPNLGFDEEALYRAGYSAFESGDKDNGRKYIDELIRRFPDGSYASQGRHALEKYGSR